jgi:hypothetical protein
LTCAYIKSRLKNRIYSFIKLISRLFALTVLEIEFAFLEVIFGLRDYPSDARVACSTSLGMDRADEAAGICAKLMTGVATSAANKATRGIKRGKLADMCSSYSFNGWVVNRRGDFRALS